MLISNHASTAIMKRLGFALIITLTLLSLNLPVYADRLKEVSVDYSADSVMESGGVKTESKVYHSGKWSRIEQVTDGASQILILQGGSRKIIALMPLMQTYMEVDKDALGTALYDPDDMDYTLTDDGTDVVDGVKTNRYKMIAIGKDGKRFEGRIWFSADNIMMKIDATAKVKGKAERVTMELYNLKIAPLKRSVFEAPQGYTKMKAFNNNGSIDKGR